MLDYQNGKIYTIRYKKDSSLIYVGSTCLPLWMRFAIHKNVCFNKDFIQSVAKVWTSLLSYVTLFMNDP